MIRLGVTISILLVQVAFVLHIARWAESMEARQRAVMRDRRCIELLAYRRNMRAAWGVMHPTIAGFEVSQEWEKHGRRWAEFRAGCSDTERYFELKEQRRVGICPNWWVKEKG